MVITLYKVAQIIFQASFAGQGVPNKDPTVWLDCRPPPISLIHNSTYSVPTLINTV